MAVDLPTLIGLLNGGSRSSLRSTGRTEAAHRHDGAREAVHRGHGRRRAAGGVNRNALRLRGIVNRVHAGSELQRDTLLKRRAVGAAALRTRMPGDEVERRSSPTRLPLESAWRGVSKHAFT
jgi:hypothetical protein